MQTWSIKSFLKTEMVSAMNSTCILTKLEMLKLIISIKTVFAARKKEKRSDFTLILAKKITEFSLHIIQILALKKSRKILLFTCISNLIFR